MDGANWELVDRWIENGELPKLKKLKKGGVWSDLESELPPVTFPNWKCYSTGKNPAKLGVHWFERVDKENQTISMVNSNDFKEKEIWDYLGEKYEVGVINMPATYPPKSVNGFMVCGGPSVKEGEFRKISSGYTYPKSLELELKRIGYRVHPKNLISSKENNEKEVEKTLEVMEKRFDLLEKKLDEVDFLHMTLFYLNNLQHFFWNGNPTKRAWKLIDRKIGELMEDDLNIILMSDHGCTEIEKVFYINTWLIKEGYLKVKETSEDFLSKLGLNRESVYSFAKKLSIARFLINIIPDGLQKILPREQGVKRERKADKIDWDRSEALAGTQGPIYILNSKVKNEVKRKLQELTLPDSKEKIAKKVYEFEELYDKEPDRYSPDLIIDQKKGIHTDAAIGPEEVFSEEDNWRAENKKTGLFLAYGDAFKNERLKTNSILDLAPTILYLYGMEIPKDLDGRILEEIFT